MLSMWVSTGTDPGWSSDMRRIQSATWSYKVKEVISREVVLCITINVNE